MRKGLRDHKGVQLLHSPAQRLMDYPVLDFLAILGRRGVLKHFQITLHGFKTLWCILGIKSTPFACREAVEYSLFAFKFYYNLESSDF